MPRSSVTSSYAASSSSTSSSSASSSSASPSSASSSTATPCSAPVYASESFILGSTCSPSAKSDPHVLSREEEEELFGRDEPQEDVPEDNTRAKDGLSDQEIPDGSLGGFKTNSAAQLSAEISSTVPLMESPKPNRVEEDREPTKAPARDEVLPESSTSKITETSKKASKKSAGKRKHRDSESVEPQTARSKAKRVRSQAPPKQQPNGEPIYVWQESYIDPRSFVVGPSYHPQPLAEVPALKPQVEPAVLTTQRNEADKGFRDYRPLPRRVMQLRPMPASVLISPICREDWQQQADAVEAKAQEEFR
ncbi:hypothetical protein CVT25_013249 [Psilocybe cyanescens]|uniref:Uncharacterized protein n=1 Tax=Psilocybe cyanescens TaxID=93625 RepID=A0A409X0P8_PSICY|nr:hypothetical protein CVT25_013249 [Psilocybe cyanescens]